MYFFEEIDSVTDVCSGQQSFAASGAGVVAAGESAVPDGSDGVDLPIDAPAVVVAA